MLTPSAPLLSAVTDRDGLVVDSSYLRFRNYRRPHPTFCQKPILIRLAWPGLSTIPTGAYLISPCRCQQYLENLASTCRCTSSVANWLDRIHALSERIYPIVKPPMQPLSSSIDLSCLQNAWNAYPNQSGGDDAHISCSFNAVSNLNRIVYNLGPLLFSQEINFLSRMELQSDKVEALQELSAWPERLPPCLKENGDAPHVLSLQ
jgi:hypothetical protein